MRSVLFGAVACVIACGTSAPDNAAQPGAVAGNVVEVTGQVTAGGKQLVVGDQVKTDDTVETGADGHVTIELLHNHARMELAANHKMKPMDSLAWTQPKASAQPVAGTDQATSAAGRPAERSAAESNTTAQQPGPGAAPVTAPGGVPAPPPPPPTGGAPADKPASRGRSGGAMPEAPTPPPPPVVQPAEAAGASVERARKDSREDIDSKSGPAPIQHVMGALPPDVVAMRKGFAQCTTDKLTLTAEVKDHVAAITFSTNADDAVKACIRRAAGTLKLTAATATYTFELN